jgi:NitT/TauT family transport system permease protein
VPTRPSIPARIALRRPSLSPADVFVGALMLALFYVAVRLGRAMTVNFTPGHSTERISTNLSNLPYYAARSLARMLIALGISTVFTFVYGTAAARLPRAQKIMVPILDILQSIPILVFLPFSLAIFINLFSGSLLGVEAASIFVIFTSQAWNMTFSFYHSLIAQPLELDEAARMYRLTKWQRFWKLDVPSSMIGLVWNAMMSMGGGWFFLTASEAVTVFVHGKSTPIELPGIGSFTGAAVEQGSFGKVIIAIGVTVIIVVGTNFLLFRPLVAWAEKFRIETSTSADTPRSIVLNILRRSSIPTLLGRIFRPVGRALDRVTRPFGLAEYPLVVDDRRRRAGDLFFWVVVGGLSALGAYAGLSYLSNHVGFNHFPYLFGLGLATFARVVVLLIASTLIWVPVGVKIGMDPKLSRYAQPVVQVLASFPAILLFPLVTLVFIDLHLSLSIGATFLMMLGAQWYILFNVIAGASSIPNDLREMGANMQLPRRLRWRRIILPAIFPYFVTGGITAAGGAWNASIVAEFVTWHHTTLHAVGLGNYIAVQSIDGKFAFLLGAGLVMSIFVVVVNRVFWRRLYRLAESRYAL